MTIILPRLILPEQSGFDKDWLIQDNILLARELLQSHKNNVRGANVAIKLDMNKAYDTLN